MRLVADNCEELVALALVSVIGCVMVLQVLLRTVFAAPLSWPEELSQFLFVWASMLGAVGACKRLQLVRLDLVAHHLPPMARGILDHIVTLLVGIFLAVLFWKSTQLAMRTSFAATTLPITWAWAYAAAPVFCVATALRMVQMQFLKYSFAFIEDRLRRAEENASAEAVA
jgi:TRAP-type transport system small permease protein